MFSNNNGKRKRIILAFGFILYASVLLFIQACSHFQQSETRMSPPLIEDAQYVGENTCKACHHTEHQFFHLSEHSNVTLSAEHRDPKLRGTESCETCHGPGSLHVATGGDKSKIIRTDEETCFACHLDVKAKNHLQFHHPVIEGKMQCTVCHSMHGNDVDSTGKPGLTSPEDTCLNCHKAQRGPFVFEHEAMRDGCTACHTPHGSINDRLLVAGPTNLCMSCHFEPDLNSTGGIGGSGHSGRGIGATSSCLDCHTTVHGSNHASTSLRY